MKKQNIYVASIVILSLLIFIFFYVYSTGDIFEMVNPLKVDQKVTITPDYSDCVIPPNIAPLNFQVKERGLHYLVKIRSSQGEVMEIYSQNSSIQIPPSRWSRLLSLNKGQVLYIDIFIQKKDGNWRQYKPVTIQIAQEDIDNYLVYRRIYPLFILWKDIGIYQRNLQNYDESLILHNKTLKNGCINCHSFHNNQPDKMIVHMRLGTGTGMLLVRDGKVLNVNTKTRFNSSHAAYRSWHPNGKILAFSVNSVRQFFHAIGENRDVFDKASDLIIYNIESNMITTCPQISSPDLMETYPEWSPDGKYLYFCRAPQLQGLQIALMDTQIYKKIKYDLMRISFDPERGEWGKAETVLSVKETGLSVAHPKISPNGHFLLFCMSAYGNFTIYNPDSDLYLMDLRTGEYHLLDINSNRSESYHSWSSNSHWFVYSSKRRDGLCAEPYFSYIDKNGKVYKSFLLPQQDPDYYDSFLMTYNVPELIKKPVKIRQNVLIEALSDKNKRIRAKLDPHVKPRAADQDDQKQMWQPANL